MSLTDGIRNMRSLLDDHDWLYQKYIVEALSTIKIGKLVDRSSKLVSLKLKQHKIKTRKISEAMSLMSDQVSKTSKKNWQNDEYKNKITASVKKAYQNQELRREAKKCSLKYWSGEESKQKASEHSKEMWARDGHKHKMAKIANKIKPEVSKKCRVKSKRNWQDPVYRQKTVSATKKACGTEKWKEDASARTLVLWQSDTYRDKVSVSLARARATPEYKKNFALGRLKQPSISYEERVISAILTEFRIAHRKIVIGPHEFDFLVDTNPPTLLEVQGEYFHPKGRPHDRSKYTYFTKYLSKRYNLHYLYDYDFCSDGLIFKKLTHMLGVNISTINVKTKELTFREVSRSDYRDFYSKYHYIGNQGKWGYSIGGFLNDKLICCVTYSGCTRKQIIDRLGVKTTEIRELSRLCRHPIYTNKNMLSKLIAESIKMIRKNRDWKYLVTYSDQTRGHTGSIFKATNWKYDGETPPSYHYIRDNHITYKKTLWDRAKKMGIKENEYAKKHNFIKMPEKSKLRFLYYL